MGGVGTGRSAGATGGGASVIPRHAGEEETHATGVGDTSEHEPCTDESGECYPGRMDKEAEQCASEHEESGSDADLAFERDGFLSTIEGETGGFPSLDASFEDGEIGEPDGGEFFGGLPCAIAGATDHDAMLMGIDEIADSVGIEFGEGMEDGAWDVCLFEFGGSADIEEERLVGGEAGLGEGGGDGGKRGCSIHGQ